MHTLKQFLRQLSTEEQAAFADRCGTTMGYIRKALSVGQRFSAELCIQFEHHSAGAVRCEDLRPDVNWAVLRGRCPDQVAA